MKLLYYNCFAGISGDMNLATMLELGVPMDYLLKELAKLNVDGYEIKVAQAIKMGISGTQVNVEIEHHHHEHHHSHDHSHSHEHRTFKLIKELITKSDLDEDVKITSIRIFEKIAIAEGKIHGKEPDEVHFHEVGAVDSIVDIVGAAICYHYIQPDKVICSSVELGGGFIDCAHGRFPVPAPATLEIIKDIPVKLGTVQYETTTPTGAAILATIVDEFTDSPSFNIQKTVYGIGHRDMEIPNVLRVSLAKLQSERESQKVKILECNIDDMPAEHFEYVMKRLMSEGAQDVFLTPIIMKKSRLATKLSVLCGTNDEEKMKNLLFIETSTLGVRSIDVDKTMLERKIEKVETRIGAVDIKLALHEGRVIKQKPEYDQCKEIALKLGIPISEVVEEVLFTYKENMQ